MHELRNDGLLTYSPESLEASGQKKALGRDDDKNGKPRKKKEEIGVGERNSSQMK